MTEYTFSGTSDASSAFEYDGGFWVLDDESHLLRKYTLDGGCDPLESLEFHQGEEADWEACVLDGSRLWICGSLGRDKKGKRRPEREVFGYISMPAGSGEVKLMHSLIDTMADAVEHSELELGKAASQPVKTAEGLNVEGLAIHPAGGVAFGLRGPLFQKEAIVLHLKNPEAAVNGEKPEWGSPLFADFGGYGIRSLENSPLGMLVSVGPVEQGGAREVAVLQPDGSHRRLVSADKDWNIEGLVWMAGPNQGLLVISDDGGTKKKKKKGEGAFRARFYPADEIKEKME